MRFVLRQEAAVVFCDDFRSVLYRVAGLLERSCLLQNVRGQDVADVVGAVRKKASDRATLGVRIVDAITNCVFFEG